MWSVYLFLPFWCCNPTLLCLDRHSHLFTCLPCHHVVHSVCIVLVSEPDHYMYVCEHFYAFVDELPPIAAASMWTRKDIKEFKDSIRKDPDSVIKVGSGETVTVSILWVRPTWQNLSSLPRLPNSGEWNSLVRSVRKMMLAWCTQSCMEKGVHRILLPG